MASRLREYIEEVNAVRQAIRKQGNKQLNSMALRQLVRELVDDYFVNLRPSLAQNDEQTDDLRPIDQLQQELLPLTHGRASISKYDRLLKELREKLIAVDTAGLVEKQKVKVTTVDADRQIIATLSTMLPSAAFSYQQAIIDLQVDSRLSWRGPATDLREAMRETLDYLAPDDEVTSMEGFKLEAGTSGPTMKQKVRYILKKRGISRTASATQEAAIESVENAVGSFVRSVYTRSSVSTHTPTDKSEVLRIRDLVRVTLCELLALQT